MSPNMSLNLATTLLQFKKFAVLAALFTFQSATAEEKYPNAITSPPPLTEFRDQLRSHNLGPKMIVIPTGGRQVPNCIAEEVCDETITDILTSLIVKPFAISKYELTFEEYDLFADETNRDKPEDNGWGRGQRPVIFVLWHDAVSYVEWLSEQTGYAYRLPSVIEWEHAARAGKATAYWWGSELGKNHANCSNCGSRWSNLRTAPVGSFPPNPWGIYDMHGNVAEFTRDCAHKKRRFRLRTRIDLYKITDVPQFYKDCRWTHTKGYSWVASHASQYRQEKAANDPHFPRRFTYISHRIRSSATGFRVVREL